MASPSSRLITVDEYAGVAFLSRPRWDAIPPQGYLRCAPELVVEVLSPSNTAAEIAEKRGLCLDNGAREFWLVDPVRRQIAVTAPDGAAAAYTEAAQIPLAAFGGDPLPAAAVFLP